MKKLILILILTQLCFDTFSQLSKFKIENYTKIDPIVQNVDSLIAEELYAQSNEWLKLIYTNPSKTIQSSLENDFIRFSGIGQKVYENAFAHMNLHYTLRIDFKDYKYRITLENYHISNSGTGNTYQLDAYIIDGKMNRRNGRIHGDLSSNILTELNGINQSLYHYLTGVTKRIKDDW